MEFTLGNSLGNVTRLHEKAGDEVETVMMDMGFNRIKTKLPQINIKTMATWEHMVEVEMHIRALKERCRGIISTLPLEHILNMLLIHLLQFVTMRLNAFRVKSGRINQHKLDTGSNYVLSIL